MSQENEVALTPVPEARVEVLPAKPQRRIWPLVGAGLVWAVRELLPEILAVWQAARNKTAQQAGLAQDVAEYLTPASQPLASGVFANRRGRRLRRGRA